MGNMSLLLPEGVDHLDELPYTIHDHIVTGLSFLRFEELPKDEQPPREIWMEHDLMKQHFKAVEAIRKEKYGLKSDDIRDTPISGPKHSIKRNAALKEITG
jgi:hypothetical protein